MADINQLLGKIGFIRSVFSEPDGSGSSSRICIAGIVIFILGAGTSLAFKIHTPITVAEMNSFLVAAGEFIATTCGPLYLINKGSEAAKNFKSTPS